MQESRSDARSSHQAMPAERLLRLPEVERIVGIRKSTIYGLMAQVPPGFPPSIDVSPRCVAWAESAIRQWVQQRIDASGQGRLNDAEHAGGAQ